MALTPVHTHNTLLHDASLGEGGGSSGGINLMVGDSQEGWGVGRADQNTQR